MARSELLNNANKVVTDRIKTRTCSSVQPSSKFINTFFKFEENFSWNGEASAARLRHSSGANYELFIELPSGFIYTFRKKKKKEKESNFLRENII